MHPELQRIKEVSDGLLYSSESDYPFGVIQIDELDLDNALLKLCNRPMNSKVEKVSPDYFFRNMIRTYPESSEEEKIRAARFTLLQKTLKENLNDIEVYRIGEIQIDAFIIGKMKNGKLAGLKTKLIET